MSVEAGNGVRGRGDGRQRIHYIHQNSIGVDTSTP